MNNQQRAAMQMALEALEKADERDGYWSYDIEITALREALAQPQDHSEQHLNMVQGKWVDLTDDEVKDVIRFGVEGVTVSEMVMFRAVARKIEAKFKEKNTPRVVPQESKNQFNPDWDVVADTTAYTRELEVKIQELEKQREAAIEATKEKAAKVCEERDDVYGTFTASDCAAAIRSMK